MFRACALVLCLVAVVLAWRLWRVWRSRPAPVRPDWWTDPDDVGRVQTPGVRRPNRLRIIGLPKMPIRKSRADSAGGHPAEPVGPGHANGSADPGYRSIPHQRLRRW